MIVSCPVCTVRMQLNAQRLDGKRITIRCARCQHVFKTEIARTPPAGNSVRVLVAHSDAELCGAIGGLLAREGISFDVCHEGGAAMASLIASPPQVALMDVALPGLFGFEVVEKVRRQPGLEKVRIILLSSVFNQAAYKRTPSSLYGADDYLEKHHIADWLVPKIRSLVDGKGAKGGRHPGAQVPAPPPLEEACEETEAYRDEVNAKIQAAEEKETAATGGSIDVEKAKRLARIIASDIALYNQDRVVAGVRSGTFFELLKDEVAEGRKLFETRIDPKIRSQEDFLQQAFDALIERQRREMAL